jgi:hypothetical protein
MLKNEWFFRELYRATSLSTKKLAGECFSSGFTGIGSPGNKRKSRPRKQSNDGNLFVE